MLRRISVASLKVQPGCKSCWNLRPSLAYNVQQAQFISALGRPSLAISASARKLSSSAEATVTLAAGESRDGPTTDSGKKQRNLAVIAHVDHGKTSLVDRLLRDTTAAELITGSMDSNELEREVRMERCIACLYVSYLVQQ